MLSSKKVVKERVAAVLPVQIAGLPIPNLYTEGISRTCRPNLSAEAIAEPSEEAKEEEAQERWREKAQRRRHRLLPLLFFFVSLVRVRLVVVVVVGSVPFSSSSLVVSTEIREKLWVFDVMFVVL